MANGNWKIIAAIILAVLITALNGSAEELQDSNSLESTDVENSAGSLRDLHGQRENMLNFYRQGLLTEFSRIIDTACDYFGRLRLITENGEIC
jgi:hypothetical protein